jgi:hypothetical protein
MDMRAAEQDERNLAQKRTADRQAEIGQIFDAAQGGDAKRGELARLLARSSNPALAQAGLSMVLKGPGEVEWKDAGDKLVAVEKATGKPTGEVLPKGVTPDTRYGKETVGADTRYGKETVGADTVFGRVTPSADALITDARAKAEGAANRGVTMRGQDLTNERALDTQRGDKPPAGYRFAGDGALEIIPGGPADPKSGKATDTERVAAGYASRMQAAEKIMTPLESSAGKPGVRESALAGMGKTGETMANALPEIMGGRSADRQSYRQAQEDWVRAKLRKESGAVIADPEMDREIRTYFPQIGDTPQVIAQKAASRQVAADAMRTAAGPTIPAAATGGGWGIRRID